jgi:ubiquinone/menaquinone biosynthesis C-methylase UbiE
MKGIWDERYAQFDYAYGTLPNDFVRHNLLKLTPGTVLFPAEGEGRNAVFAASQGWKSYAFDQSIEGKKKALALAHLIDVNIDYYINEGTELPYAVNQFDVIVFCYAHFPPSVKESIIAKTLTFLKPGGLVIFEAFSKKHLEYNAANPAIGGPKDEALLFSVNEMKQLFEGFTFEYLNEEEIELKEGLYHNGKGHVVRMIARKP